jgi:hypothetical protein
VTKENPKRPSAGHAPLTSDIATPPRINSTSTAAPSVEARKILS